MFQKHELLLLLIIVSNFVATDCADLWNSDKCDKGCRQDSQCPKNAECKLFDQNENCGVCRCSSGFEQKGNKCVGSDGGAGGKPSKDVKGKKSTSGTSTTSSASTTSSSTSTTASSTSTSTSTTVTTTTATTTTAVPTQGPPPAPEALDCSFYDCGVSVEVASDSDASKVRTQKIGTAPPGCRRSIGTSKVVCKSPLPDGDKACYGAYCLPATPSKSYCICPPFKNGLKCQEEKSGKCSTGNGQVSSKGSTIKDKKFVNIKDPDSGSIWTRHFAANLSDCVKLCQWDGRCRSANFGSLGGQNVCELLTISFTPGTGSTLETWMQSAPGWTFVTL